MSDAPKVPAGQQLAQAAEAYIRAHSTEKFSLKTLSAALYVNGSYLLRAFRKETGHTLLWYHNAVRCEEASVLLLTTDLNVSRIGERVGFISSAHFSRIFREMTGFSPTDARARMREEQGAGRTPSLFHADA